MSAPTLLTAITWRIVSQSLRLLCGRLHRHVDSRAHAETAPLTRSFSCLSAPGVVPMPPTPCIAHHHAQP